MSEEREKLEEVELFDGAGGVFRVGVEWRVSERARRLGLRMRVDGAGVCVVVPARLAKKSGWREDGLAFLKRYGAWILRARKRVAKRSAAMPAHRTLAEALAALGRVSYGGLECPLVCEETAVRPFFMFKRDGSSPVHFKYRAGANNEADLLALLRGLASKVLPPRVNELAARVGVKVGRVGVRDQRSRWGSCARAGTVSLNWRLILLPAAIQDHVILHELAHRVEMNHSERFWDLLTSWDANTLAHDTALNKEWGWLMRLARGAR